MKSIAEILVMVVGSASLFRSMVVADHKLICYDSLVCCLLDHAVSSSYHRSTMKSTLFFSQIIFPELINVLIVFFCCTQTYGRRCQLLSSCVEIAQPFRRYNFAALGRPLLHWANETFIVFLTAFGGSDFLVRGDARAGDFAADVAAAVTAFSSCSTCAASSGEERSSVKTDPL